MPSAWRRLRSFRKYWKDVYKRQMQQNIHGGDIYSRQIRLDFSVNGNPLGMPDAAVQAIHEAVQHVGEYPDITAAALTEAVSRMLSGECGREIPKEYLLFGNGASELFLAVVHALKPRNIVIPVPSFYGYEYVAEAAGSHIKYVYLPEETGFRPGRELLQELTADTDMLFVANPNKDVYKRQGVTQSGQEVTLAVAKSMARKGSSVCKMAQSIGAETIPVDIGINSEESIPGVLDRKVRPGTRNFLKEPTMTEEETVRAIVTGIKLVQDCKEKGYGLLATGEMGIGNTTTSSAVTAALLQCEAGEVTGRGAGLTDQGLTRKQQVVRTALETYDLWHADAFTVLQTVGGLDIAGLTLSLIHI